MRSLDCARDDRMIVAEEFSDNLSHIYFAWGRIAHFHIACHIPEELELRTSESFQLRTPNSFLLRTPNPFLPHTLGNRGEVERCLTAGGSPKGNTCGLPHLSSFSHIDLERGRTTQDHVRMLVQLPASLSLSSFMHGYSLYVREGRSDAVHHEPKRVT